MRKLKLTLLALTAFLSLCAAQAEVHLPNIFSSHMVLQRDKPIAIWGWASPGEAITIQLDTTTVTATANATGEWKATLPAMKAGGPYTLTVTGSNKIQFEDVMIGEVWLCSGQSNMEMGIGMVNDATNEIAAATNAGVRLLMVANRWLPQPQTNIVADGINGQWKLCTPKTIAEGGWGGFSATAYFFARELNAKLGVTVGVIDSTWGGTRIESWTPPEGFAAVPALQHEYELVQLGDPRTEVHQQRLQSVITETEKWLEDARRAKADKTEVPALPVVPAELQFPHDLQQDTALYNGMINPLVHYTLRGAIWYQGESNLHDGDLYRSRMKALINGWREIWGQSEFPFFFVQIAPYNYGGDPEIIGPLWEAQTAAAQQIPDTGMIVINDIGNTKDIHPKNKQEVARRLSLLALSKTYGQSGLEFSGPTFKAMTIEDDKIRVTFDHADGLASRDGKPLTWFEIIDADEGGFMKAEAKIDGSSIVLSAPEVKHPVAMRFAWNMLAEPNLMNAAGLPCSAFRAGNAPKRDLLTLHVPEAKDYQLALDLDLNKLGANIQYEADHRAELHQPYDRIAYFLELQEANGPTQYLYASMDAFTDDLGKIGIPTVQSGAHFQQNIKNLTVYSNVKGIITGTNMKGGNIEFWPNNYGEANSAKVPNASATIYDFGDQPFDPADGYGSMQIHNHAAKQTLFALNHWKEGAKADLGIGNQSKGNPDWTFAANAGSYKSARLRVLVHLK